MTGKQIALERVQELPDTMSLDEIVEELAVLSEIHKGIDDLEAGRVVPHEEVKRMVASWATK